MTVNRFRDWFWRPPRAHGDIIRDRVVSPVELLYDLVYVAAISQAARQLATEVSGVHLVEFGLGIARRELGNACSPGLLPFGLLVFVGRVGLRPGNFRSISTHFIEP